MGTQFSISCRLDARPIISETFEGCRGSKESFESSVCDKKNGTIYAFEQIVSRRRTEICVNRRETGKLLLRDADCFTKTKTVRIEGIQIGNSSPLSILEKPNRRTICDQRAIRMPCRVNTLQSLTVCRSNRRGPVLIGGRELKICIVVWTGSNRLRSMILLPD